MVVSNAIFYYIKTLIITLIATVFRFWRCTPHAMKIVLKRLLPTG